MKISGLIIYDKLQEAFLFMRFCIFRKEQLSFLITFQILLIIHTELIINIGKAICVHHTGQRLALRIPFFEFWLLHRCRNGFSLHYLIRKHDPYRLLIAVDIHRYRICFCFIFPVKLILWIRILSASQKEIPKVRIH